MRGEDVGDIHYTRIMLLSDVRYVTLSIKSRENVSGTMKEYVLDVRGKEVLVRGWAARRIFISD